MVSAHITLDEKTNRVINIVKAKYNLKDKSAAIGKIISYYEEFILEDKLRPEYIENLSE